MSKEENWKQDIADIIEKHIGYNMPALDCYNDMVSVVNRIIQSEYERGKKEGSPCE